MQFYDPSAILDISRDVALGYLILLTGGMLEYEPPTSLAQKPPQDDSQEIAPTNNHKPATTSTLDEESASLAYAAIVDGNVLHACFGLKATVGTNSSVPTLGEKNKQSSSSSSLLCCFPTTSATLQLVLPHAAKNKLKMQNLMEVLREVGDLHDEALLATSGIASPTAADDGNKNMPVYTKVIRAYTHCFTAIVRYHDAKKFLTKKDSDSKEGNTSCFSNILKKLKEFATKSKCNPPLEKLQSDTLSDIDHGFQGLKEGIWESLENMAAETAFTGVSMEGSPLRVSGGNT